MIVRSLMFVASIAAVAVAQAPSTHTYRPGVDVLDYAFRIDLPDTGSLIKGDAELLVKRTARVDSLVLDLRKLDVQRVLVAGRQSAFSRTDSTIAIPLPAGDSGTFRIRVQ